MGTCIGSKREIKVQMKVEKIKDNESKSSLTGEPVKKDSNLKGSTLIADVNNPQIDFSLNKSINQKEISDLSHLGKSIEKKNSADDETEIGKEDQNEEKKNK